MNEAAPKTTVSELQQTGDLAEYRRIGPPLGPEAAGQRADAFLAKFFPFHSRAAWRAIADRQALLCNGKPIKASKRLAMGDLLAVHHPLSAEPEADTAIRLIAEAGGVIAVYKPGNLPMHESGDFRRKTFGAQLEKEFGKEWFPAHRLDRETSGVVICAATTELRHQLALAFFERRVEKRYEAIVFGETSWERLVVDRPIAPDPRPGRPRYIVADHGGEAVTEFKTLERAPGGDASLLRIRPKTGKTNQIRVHAMAIGHSLVGDKIYHPNPEVYEMYHARGDTEEVRELAGFARHALHAAAVELTHPETGARFVAEAELPGDLAGLWAELRRGASQR